MNCYLFTNKYPNKMVVKYVPLFQIVKGSKVWIVFKLIRYFTVFIKKTTKYYLIYNFCIACDKMNFKYYEEY